MNTLLLHCLATESAPGLTGVGLRRAAWLKPLLVMELGDSRKPTFLVVVTHAPGPFCYLDTEDPLMGRGDVIFKRLWGERLGDTAVSDRVWRLPVADQSLTITLAGNRARARVESDEYIVESTDDDEAGAPAPTGESGPDVASAAADELTMEPLAARISRQWGHAFGEVSFDTAAFVDFRNRLKTTGLSFHLFTRGNPGKAIPSPQPVRDAKQNWGPFATARDGCTAVGREIADRARTDILERTARVVDRHRDGRARLIHKLEAELKHTEKAQTQREEADILSAFRGQVPTGADRVKLPDVYAEGSEREIVLNPKQTLNHEINKRYKEAARLEKRAEAIPSRIAAIRAELDTLTRERDAALALPFGGAHQALIRMIGEHGLARQKRAFASAQRPEKTWRTYDLDADWFVLVGRNDDENDEITFKKAAPDDIWMHAQQVPGSHVVLKSRGGQDNPSERVLEAAAAVAAYYSKARKSALVPVIYTKRKYVRKFRGAKPGQVRCEREKTVFVAPELPPEDSTK